MKECSLEDCFRYVEEILKALVNSRNAKNSIEEFARWNTANDLASDWENCSYFLDRLYGAGKITQDVKEKILHIDNRLSEASLGGRLYEEAIWSNDGIVNHKFWKDLREEAEIVLNDLSRWR